MSVKKIRFTPWFISPALSTLQKRGEERLYSCQAFATRSPDRNQHFCVFSKAPWLFHNINWAETKFWAKREEMVSDVSVKTSIFLPCSFTNSLIYSGTFREERRGLSLSADVNQQFMGWRERARSWRNLWKEESELVLCTFTVLGSNHTYPIILTQTVPFISE